MTELEFYNSKVIELMKKREQGTIDVLNFRNELDQVAEQAKAMEEQAKVEFAFKAYSEMISTGKSFVDIVNSMRTFKSE